MQLKCRSLIAEIAPDLSGADASGGQFADDETVSKAGIVVVDIDRVEQVRVIPVSRGHRTLLPEVQRWGGEAEHPAGHRDGIPSAARSRTSGYIISG